MSKYIQNEYLGSGTYSSVFIGTDISNNARIALKRIKFNDSEGIPATTLREVSILKNLNHQNILKLVDVSLTHSNCTIIFEYIEYSLYAYMKKFKRCLHLAKQLGEGINYIHSCSIIHRDLKPDNILVKSDGTLKISDFNLSRSKKFARSSLSTEVVSLWYRSPELLKGQSEYSYFIDIWSAGCIMAEIMGSKPLFMGKDAPSQLQEIKQFCKDTNILKKKLRDQIICYDRHLFEVVVQCLSYKPTYRITAKNISESLKHKFIK